MNLSWTYCNIPWDKSSSLPGTSRDCDTAGDQKRRYWHWGKKMKNNHGFCMKWPSYLATYLSLYFSIIYLSPIYPSIHLSIYLSIYHLSIYPSIYLSINQSINLSIYLSIQRVVAGVVSNWATHVSNKLSLLIGATNELSAHSWWECLRHLQPADPGDPPNR